MITSLIFWIVKLVLGILAVVFGLVFGMVLLGVSFPVGIYHQIGRFCSFVIKKVK